MIRQTDWNRIASGIAAIIIMFQYNTGFFDFFQKLAMQEKPIYFTEKSEQLSSFTRFWCGR